MKTSWKKWMDEEAVSPVIATILMVAITVVLAAVLYVMVMGLGGQESQTTPVATFTFEEAKAGTTWHYIEIKHISGTTIDLKEVEIIIEQGGNTFTIDPAAEPGNTDAIAAGSYLYLNSLDDGATWTVTVGSSNLTATGTGNLAKSGTLSDLSTGSLVKITLQWNPSSQAVTTLQKVADAA